MNRRVLVVSLQVSASSSKGHINPLVAVVERLVTSGHRVGWMSLPSALGAEDRRQVAGTGAVLVEPRRVPPERPVDERQLSAWAMDPQRAWQAYRSFLLDAAARMIAPAREEMAAFRPDVVLVDSMSYAGVIAAAALGVPYVGVCAGLKSLKEGGFEGGYMHDLSPLLPERTALFAQHGMHPEFRLLECLSPHANVVFATRALVGDVPLPLRTLLVGPSIPRGARGDEVDFPWDRLAADRPIVHAAFGSVHTRERLGDLVLPLAEATAGLGAQLVISSEALSRELPCLPGDPLIVPYSPQLRLLQRVSAFVTHGGANSVMEAVWAGAPLLVVPLSGDQVWQAHLVARSGVGLALPRAELTVANLRTALAQLVDMSGPVRRRMQAARESYRLADGAAMTAGIALDLATKADHALARA